MLLDEKELAAWQRHAGGSFSAFIDSDTAIRTFPSLKNSVAERQWISFRI
jgi:hypothetical protein